jgi:hypothetical protein
MPITRRADLAALLGVVTTPVVARAQRPARIPRIGVIGERSRTDHFLAAFGQGLRDLGYVESQIVHIESR